MRYSQTGKLRVQEHYLLFYLHGKYFTPFNGLRNPFCAFYITVTSNKSDFLEFIVHFQQIVAEIYKKMWFVLANMKECRAG